MIYCRTLGPLAVTVDGDPAPPELLWRKNLALLLYLARAPAHRCTRDHAIGLLWPDKEESASRQSLREAVRVLRRCLGETNLRTVGDQLELAAGAVELDTDRFDRYVAGGQWAEATPLIGGEFVEGFAVPDASAFEDWLLAERWHWRARAMEALIRHAEERLEAGDLLGADDPARRALKVDPLSDRAVRTLMRRLALAGDRSSALDLYTQFAERVARERNAPVDAETEALVSRLRRNKRWNLPRGALTVERGVEWRRAPLLGREQPLTDVLAQWREVRSGRLALIVIEAAAGGGKTRLAEEVMARVGLDGGVCVAMRAVPADVDSPGSGIVSLLRGGLLDAPGVAAAHPSALAAIAAQASEWAERFPAARGEGPPWTVGAALMEIVRVSAAEQPLLLVFDDAQWVDAASYDVIETLVRDLARAPVLVVLAATPEPAPPKLAELRARIGRELRGATIPLRTLNQSAMQALVRWALPAYSDEEVSRLSRRIALDSAGVPLLAVEICHAVAQGLDLDATSGAWPRPLRTLDQTLPGDLPDTIVAAIRVGFRCLSPDAQRALVAAAVLGERSEAGRIGRAAGLEREALHAALDELEWRRWLVAESRGYAFAARIVRDVVARDMVTAGQRQRILAQ
jgi:DNA-binding SARP family transcriptional activator